MASRYDGKRILINNSELYKELYRTRGVNFFKHFELGKLKYPTAEEIADLELIGYIWSMEDRWWKVAAKYYGSAELWYILALFNKKPTDFHVKTGQIIYVPQPIEKIMKYLGI